MVDFRYAQFCPLTRAVEILGERWTILILRELFLGPKRFRDLKSALNGVSPSVLADRLSKLEERGIVARRELPAPASALVYELDEAGRALQPLLVELTRWGVRFLGAAGSGDSIRPEWLSLGLQVFARRDPVEEIGALFQVDDGNESIDLYVRGGEGGTVVSRSPLPHQIRVHAAPLAVLRFASGAASADDAGVHVDGDPGIAGRIPGLFDFRPTPAAPLQVTAGSPIPKTAPRPRAGRNKTAAVDRGREGATRA